jgi:hypothetical protein
MKERTYAETVLERIVMKTCKLECDVHLCGGDRYADLDPSLDKTSFASWARSFLLVCFDPHCYGLVAYFFPFCSLSSLLDVTVTRSDTAQQFQIYVAAKRISRTFGSA